MLSLDKALSLYTSDGYGEIIFAPYGVVAGS